jgi:subtilisin
MSDTEKDQQKSARKAGSVGQSAQDTSEATAAGKQFSETTASSQTGPFGRSSAAGEGRNRDASGDILNQGLSEREMQYLITPRHGNRALSAMGLGALAAQTTMAPDMDRIHNALKTMNNVTVIRRIRPSGVSVLSAGIGAGNDILVVRTKAEDRRFLDGLSHPGLIIERDHLLGHLADSTPFGYGSNNIKPLKIAMGSVTLQFHVIDTNGNPQQNAKICLYTVAGGEATGSTDANGDATMVVNCGYINDIAAIYVKPIADCWEKFVSRPYLQSGEMNTVVLKRLPEFRPAWFAYPANGERSFCGWGQRLMGLDQVSISQATGVGVKVAIIDSGCDNTHPALTHIKIGRDFTNLNANQEPDQMSWTTDTMCHGTHCSGIIAGNGINGHIRGFVPQAEVHVLKLFPGGAFNNLAAALHYCIDNQIDVVNCSLGGEQTSETIQQMIEMARQAGIAVVVAAGNSGGPVQFPASVPGVLCITAIGELGEYPDDTYHAQTCTPGTAGVGGLFPANFSCSGPQVSLCAPGVAVISSVPGGGYASWDGTSMAAPAVAGLLAMVLAHHPMFVGQPVVRNSDRVDRLFQIVAQAAAPVAMQPQRVGAGLPRVTNAPAAAWTRRTDDPKGATSAAGAQITQAKLEEIVRKAFISSLNTFVSNNQPPVV